MTRMNAYDFDGTIFDGDATVRFLAFCARHYPRVWLHLPALIGSGTLFAFKLMEKTAFKQKLFAFVKDIPDMDAALARFWRENERHIRAWYKKQRREDDVIISASPEFLLKPMAEKLGARLIASRVDPHTGRFDGHNCHGKEKVRRFAAEFGDAQPDEFYSDTRSDEPMARLAQRAFVVKGETITPWEERFPYQ